MEDKKPKDLMLAEVAYNEFYEQQPCVWFDNLNHNYQMRWVRAVRAVLADYKKVTPKGVGRPKGLVLTKAEMNERDQELFTELPARERSQEERKARQRFAKRNQR